MSSTTIKAKGIPLRALILEDSDDDAVLLLDHLKRSGYDVTPARAESAAGARRALGEGAYDVVFADYSMPSFTALDALGIISQLQIDVPFIIVSGSIGESAAVEAMKAGAHDFFLKGNLTRLASAVERERGEARVRQERQRMIQELRESQERLRQAVLARDEFLSIASHELKTPLTSLTLHIDSTVKALDAGGTLPPDKLRGKLVNVSLQVSRLTALINNLLEVTRITSDRLELAPTELDLGELVQSVVTGLDEERRRSGSTITLKNVEPVKGPFDRFAIESVFVNLVSNAIKYGAGNPIDIELGLSDGSARLVVSDHGIGIAPEEQERIFYRFERAVPKEHYGGFGLGLWVARQIVEAHRGTIAVVSKPGSGSVFSVTLPLERRG